MWPLNNSTHVLFLFSFPSLFKNMMGAGGLMFELSGHELIF